MLQRGRGNDYIDNKHAAIGEWHYTVPYAVIDCSARNFFLFDDESFFCLSYETVRESCRFMRLEGGYFIDANRLNRVDCFRPDARDIADLTNLFPIGVLLRGLHDVH